MIKWNFIDLGNKTMSIFNFGIITQQWIIDDSITTAWRKISERSRRELVGLRTRVVL